MAWVIILQGACISVQSEELEQKFSELPGYEAIATKCRELGLVFTSGADPERDLLNIFLGIDLYPDRHLTQGQAVTIDSVAELPACFDDLCHEVLAMAMSLSDSATINTGLVVYHFD